ALKIHNGAVDRSMVTTGSPQQVFTNVTEVLHGMGIKIAQDGAFSYRCVRPKRKKNVAPSSHRPGPPGQALEPHDFVPFTPVTPDGPNFPESSANSFLAGSEPIYGGASTKDKGGEVRFSVELTRISGLDDTLSLDMRRMKGDLGSYKFLYDTLRE
ncbi:uncharacterized protein EI90DRAFT_2912776, partial [Cantharellus anzutake]|uniref:uncharacterized protein n=1 Tax=Cantharellus anzutake TaxID=1750568 RepID=UPI001906EDCB